MDKDLKLSEEDTEFKFYINLLNIFQVWYNKTIEPSYPSMVEDTDDPTYTNGALETFYEFMSDFKLNINNLSMTRIYDLDDFIYNKYSELYEEYFQLEITNKNGDITHYASPLIFPLLIFLSKQDWINFKWNIYII